MKATANRFLLRDATRQYHEQVDAEVGEFGDRVSYMRYLSGMWSFRAAVEPQMRCLSYPAELGCWRPTLIQSELTEDIRDLGIESWGNPVKFAMPQDLSGLLGVLYVLEGSALGARVLVKRAASLGYSGSFGARHLSLQTSKPDSWIGFQNILEDADPFDIESAAKAAIDTFKTARQAFKEIRYAERQS